MELRVRAHQQGSATEAGRSSSKSSDGDSSRTVIVLLGPRSGS